MNRVVHFKPCPGKIIGSFIPVKLTGKTTLEHTEEVAQSIDQRRNLLYQANY